MTVKDSDERNMRPTENSSDSTNAMDLAFHNIMEEIVEHVIEGVCFEVHRAVKLGYFPMQEFILKDRQFELAENNDDPQPECDIFANDKNKVVPFHPCPYCKYEKSLDQYVRHLSSCRSKPPDDSVQDKGGKKEDTENNGEEGLLSDDDDLDRKKGNDAKKAAKNMLSYETMSADEIQGFLKERCGVISSRTGKPCNNTLKCSSHSAEDRIGVRSQFGSTTDQFLDGNIDIDTVDQE